MIAEQPIVSLSYNPVSGEFTLKVLNTSQVSYTIEYDWENLDDEGEPYGGTDALLNTEDADAQNVFQDTQLAGTESNDDKFVHTPTKGVLTLSADTLDGKVMTYQSSFKITEDGSIKTITERTSTKAKSELSVLGDSSESASPVQATFTQPVLEKRANTVQPLNLENDQDVQQVPVVPLAIGIGITLTIVGLLAVWWFKKRKTTITKL